MADGPRWSELPSAQLAIELAKLGITTKTLTLDIRDVPELREAVSRMNAEEKLKLALVYFGDEGHPQPEERSDWQITGRTPDWGRLPPRPGEQDAVDPDLSGDPLPALAVLEALRQYANGATIRQVEDSTEFSFRLARRVDTWHRSGAVRWNVARKTIEVADGYRLDRAGQGEAATLRLVQA